MSLAETINILQFGNGNFLRGFADWVFQQLNDRRILEAGIHSVQIHTPKLDERMLRQNNQFHVWIAGLENGQKVDRIDRINCIKKYSSIFDSYEEYLKIAENAELRWVISNTTEVGIIFDTQDDSYLKIPKTFPGKLTALLFRRFDFFEGDAAKGLQILPCELIEKNGEKLKECVLAYAQLWQLPKSFEDWLNESVLFYNSLVDRIVPGFPKEKINSIEEKPGGKDELLVMAEPYYFWAIEGAEKLKSEIDWEKAGLNVKFVKNLEVYRSRKVRILNGAHTALVPYAYLKGFRDVRTAVENPEIYHFLKTLIYEEIIPTLALPEKELRDFADSVLERFTNPFIDHKLQSIALNSISKFRVRVLPSICTFYRQRGILPENLIISFAVLLIFYKGKFKEELLPIQDDNEVLKFFDESWKKSDFNLAVETILANQEIWGQDLNLLSGLKEQLVKEIDKILKV
ncbi:tagaturonate reductase [Algoriphagus hitonicola]|uniref:Tagaturonate reductase n=1 Tax=Algoriphagus hitonicola TaxID=435880 RepID=A0A1I2WFR2_9BACT|nr:tagaturonate reductase [Algoriphagus hitonicola]SFG99166.1 tagaturonate reductase [Algoriphagus hitonicola]